MKFHQPPATYINTVSLKVANLERSLQFYTEILCFDVLSQDSNNASLTVDGQNTLLTLKQTDKFAKTLRKTVGLYHFALLLPKRTDLANIVRHLIQNGIRFGSGDHLVSEAIYFSDPDGNGIEIYADRKETEWNWDHGDIEMTTLPVDFADLLSMKDEENWEAFPPRTVLGHLHLQVDDLYINERFYKEGLGFDLVNRYGDHALFLSSNCYHHHIAFNTWAGKGLQQIRENDVGIESFSIVFPDEQTRKRVVRTVKNMGEKITKEAERYIVYDPSNIKVYLDLYSS